MSNVIEKLKTSPEAVSFQEVIAFIDANYGYTPCKFVNGSGDRAAVNEAGTNEGSCKIFAFAQLNALSEAETLQCFGDYYRKDVLENPEGSDHANIRNFMKTGWGGVTFDGQALSSK